MHEEVWSGILVTTPFSDCKTPINNSTIRVQCEIKQTYQQRYPNRYSNNNTKDKMVQSVYFPQELPEDLCVWTHFQSLSNFCQTLVSGREMDCILPSLQWRERGGGGRGGRKRGRGKEDGEERERGGEGEGERGGEGKKTEKRGRGRKRERGRGGEGERGEGRGERGGRGGSGTCKYVERDDVASLNMQWRDSLADGLD